MTFETGQRVKLAPNRSGFWMAHLFGLYYLDLNDQPTGTVVGIDVSRDPAGDLINVAIDGHPAPGSTWPRLWGFSRGLLLPAAVDERRPAPVCDGIGQPVAVETVRAALREYVSQAPDFFLLRPRATVLRHLQDSEEKTV